VRFVVLIWGSLLLVVACCSSSRPRTTWNDTRMTGRPTFICSSSVSRRINYGLQSTKAGFDLRKMRGARDWYWKPPGSFRRRASNDDQTAQNEKSATKQQGKNKILVAKKDLRFGFVRRVAAAKAGNDCTAIKRFPLLTRIQPSSCLWLSSSPPCPISSFVVVVCVVISPCSLFPTVRLQ